MFCYQCQETAKGTGCILKGVCGKDAATARSMDLLLFVVRGIAVAAGDGQCVLITQLQPEGSKRMSAADYLLGHPMKG